MPQGRKLTQARARLGKWNADEADDADERGGAAPQG